MINMIINSGCLSVIIIVIELDKWNEKNFIIKNRELIEREGFNIYLKENWNFW